MNARRFIKIQMSPERFWVSLSLEDFKQIQPLADGSFTTDVLLRARVENNCIEWPFVAGTIIPITGQTRIMEVMDSDEILDDGLLEI